MAPSIPPYRDWRTAVLSPRSGARPKTIGRLGSIRSREKGAPNSRAKKVSGGELHLRLGAFWGPSRERHKRCCDVDALTMTSTLKSIRTLRWKQIGSSAKDSLRKKLEPRPPG